MKKFIAFIFAAFFAAVSFAATETVDGVTYTYSIANGEATIGDGSSSAIPRSTSGALVIPSTLGGCPVTTIGEDAFYDCSSLTSVTIPSSVTTIGGSAFYGCSSLTSVTIPSSVTTIGDWAFGGCSSLTSVTIPSSVTTIEGSAFSDCSKLQSFTVAAANPFYCTIDGILYTKDRLTLVACPGAKTLVTIPEGVTTIGTSAFESCPSLTSVTIPESVTAIGDHAFCGCSSLTSVTIPESVTTIERSAFYHCSSLTSVTIPEGVTTIGDNAFFGCSSLTSVTILEGVTTIGGAAFFGCSSLTSVTIPSSVTTIGGSAFCGCSSLTSVTIPGGVTTIERGAFGGCRSLTSVTIPSSVTTIGDNAFFDCRSLTSVTIPEGVTTIEGLAFSGCSSLSSVTIPESVTTIEGSAFSGCSSLTSVTIPEGVTTIGNSAFSGCSKLQSFTVAAANPSYCTIDGILYTKDRLTLVACPGAKTSVTIPEGVTTIGKYAFYECTSLTSVTIPEGVTTIGGDAFRSCSSLTSVTIPEGVTTIGDWAFYGCSSLTSVTIPSSVTTIESGAFGWCSSLRTVYVDYGDTDRVKELMRGKGVDVDALTFVEIPRKLADGGPYTETVDGVVYEFTIFNGEVTIEGCPDSAKPSGSLVVPSTLGGCPVTTLSDYAFGNCSSLTSVTIPSSVTTIGGRAFYNCNSIAEVRFDGDIPDVSHSSFSDTLWYAKGIIRLLANASAEGAANTVTVKQEVTHYVLNSTQPTFVLPATYDTGFVNVIAEVKGGCVAIPATWTVNYPKFTEKFGSDFTKALSAKTGKIAAGGREMLVWEDYVAGTDPTDPNDKFTASMTMVDGKPVISWTPELDDERAAMRKYTTYGKRSLLDSDWEVVPVGEEANYNFFKVSVEMR